MSDLDRYMPEHARQVLEQEFYASVNQQAVFERLIDNPDFWKAPGLHVGLYSDHGVVHVRNVAQQILDVLDTINGVLIPRREHYRLDFFMRGYGVLLAYLHDIGMRDFSAFGRAMHPEFASQYIFSPAFDELFELLWAENSGNIAWRLTNLAGLFTQSPQVVLREMLALSNCHSKSKVPVAVLNDPARLREIMLRVLTTDLGTLYAEYHRDEAGQMDRPLNMELDGTEAARQHVERFYERFEEDAFAWLISPHPDVQMLRDDVIDTLRALRCADALRQRGTVLKTSGNYEVFVDQMSANAIYALRNGDEQLYLLELSNPIACGEANLASSELGIDGNLRVSFHRGAFMSDATTRRAALCAAVVIDDIQSDVVESFARASHDQRVKPHDDIKVLLEGVDDNLNFAELVLEALIQRKPVFAERAQCVPSLQNATPAERALYLGAPAIDWTIAELAELLAYVRSSGQQVEHMMLEKAFQHVKRIHIEAGSTLIEAGSQASFVYIPFKEGLKVLPLGGYQAFSVRAWMPLGSTGVIRGAARNATVISDQAMDLLMIPRETYLKYWHKPYTPATLEQRLTRA